MKKLIIGFVATLAMLAPVAFSQPALAQNSGASQQVLSGVSSVDSGNNNTNLNDSIKNAVNMLLFIGGAVAVIMIVIGGIRFVISNGDMGTVTSARNTVLYSVIGLVVMILAYAIVNFVATNI